MKTWLIVGGAAVGVYLAYKYLQAYTGAASGPLTSSNSTVATVPGGGAGNPTTMTTAGATNTARGRIVPLGGLTRINVPTIRSVVGGGAPSAPDPSAPFVATNSPSQQTVPTVPQATATAPRPTTLTFGTATTLGGPRINPLGGLVR